jgi:hypothetical protein
MTKLDDAIRALCALRQEQDPVGYPYFIGTLMPHVIIIDDPEPHSGTVTAEGRTATVIDDLEPK